MSPDGLKAFLYILLRDHVTVGQVEDVMCNHVEPMLKRGLTPRFSSDALHGYVEELTVRLRPTATAQEDQP